jgi:hypothetical protein
MDHDSPLQPARVLSMIQFNVEGETMSYLRLLSISLAVGILAGCASSGKVRHIAGFYEQENVKTLVEQWGEPTKTVILDNGMKEYQYGDDQGYTHRYNPKTHEMDSTPNGCLTVFTVDTDSIVVKWQERGMSCKTTEP